MDAKVNADTLSPELSMAITQHVQAAMEIEYGHLQKTGETKSGRDTNIYQLVGSGWVVAVMVLGLAWIFIRHRKQNERGLAAAIEGMGEGRQRDRLLGKIEKNVPHQRLWNRTIRQYRVKRKKKQGEHA